MPTRRPAGSARCCRSGVMTCGIHHARSTTLAPSRPCGRKTSTKISNTNAQTSFHAEPPKVPGMKVYHALDQAEHQPADDSTIDIADAAEHRCGEGLEAGQEAHPEVDVGVTQAPGQAGHCGQGCAERERHHDDAVDIDAHQPRGVGVLGCRLHRPTETGAVDEHVQEGPADDERNHGEQRGTLDGEGPTWMAGPVTKSICGKGIARLGVREARHRVRRTAGRILEERPTRRSR